MEYLLSSQFDEAQICILHGKNGITRLITLSYNEPLTRTLDDTVTVRTCREALEICPWDSHQSF